jgi:DNA (cytosine-5)-methyltransferase 1
MPRDYSFDAGWTKPAEAEPSGHRCRWRLVGNAVSVKVASWLADRLCQSAGYDADRDLELSGRTQDQ